MPLSKTEAWNQLRNATDNYGAKCSEDQPDLPSFCIRCPILKECYNYAEADDFAEGVWGGMVWELRRKAVEVGW